MDRTANFALAARFLEPSEIEAFAAEQDPFKTWIHFIFTDDKPNKNNQRVPSTEFANLVKTAKFMPIKKVIGGVGDTHEGAVPMGSIASTKVVKEDKVSRIEGLAALWNKEFPEDIGYLRQKFAEGESINFSWEIGYTNANEDIEYPGVELLTGCSTRAATIVAMPAYGGRTRAIAMAAIGESFEERIEKLDTVLRQYTLEDADGYKRSKYYLKQTFNNLVVIKDNEDGNFYQVDYAVSEDGKVVFDFAGRVRVVEEYIEAHKLNVLTDLEKSEQKRNANSRRLATVAKRHGKEVALDKDGGNSNMELKDIKELFAGLEPADKALAALDSVEDLFKEWEGVKTERDTLLDEKKVREEEDARTATLRERLSALKEAGIEYSNEELEVNAKAIVEMSDEAFKLFVAQLSAALKAKVEPGTASAGVRIPQSTGSAPTSGDRLAIIKKALVEKPKTEEAK